MPDPDPWTCATCRTPYPIRSLARLCEATHETHEPHDEEQE